MSRLAVAVLALLSVVLSGLLAGCIGEKSTVTLSPATALEPRLARVKQLTFGGENAEAYFSADGGQLVFQSTRDGLGCDAIFSMTADGANQTMISGGTGRTTCAYFFPDGSRIIYASTHLGGEECPPTPSRREGGRYVWPIYESYDLFSCKPDGSDLQRLTATSGYDAEATVSPDGRKVVFTSVRNGDLDLYTMNPDGSGVEQVTDLPGYDGGAFFSPDSTMLCFRASRPEGEQLQAYRSLLAEGLVEPTRLEILVCKVDGSGLRQVTRNGAANFCPYFHPSGKKIIYASNKADQKGYNFDLYLVDLESDQDERVTFDPTFDAFPMFSPDGKKLVWGSNRNPAPGHERDTNIFIADWVEEP